MTNHLINYAYFNNKFELDQATTMHENYHAQNLNKTDRAVLTIIRQYSVKFGAAHLKHDTIAETLGKSNVTIRRAIRKLTALNIIETSRYVRPVLSGFGANIYAIKPFVMPEANDAPKQHEPPQIQTIDEPLQSVSQPVIEQQPTFFERMKELLSSSIGSTKEARRFFGAYRQLTERLLKFSIYEQQGELFEQLGLQALQISVQATKRKHIYNLPGYYKGVLRKLIDEALFNEMFMEYTIPFEGVMFGNEI